ncbi:MAG: dehalogenase [Dehalogenimonas sp.]
MIENYSGQMNEGTFLWIAICLIGGVGLSLLIKWLHQHNIKTTWYDWFLGLMGILLFFFTIQNFVTSFGEYEAQAAWMFMLTIGVPSLILMGLSALSVVRHNQKQTTDHTD